jgi:hypothetical protein
MVERLFALTEHFQQFDFAFASDKLLFCLVNWAAGNPCDHGMAAAPNLDMNAFPWEETRTRCLGV